MIDQRWLVPALVAALSAGAPALAQTPVEWNGDILKHEAAWYATPGARAIADSVIQHQSAEGGWPKNTPLTVPPGTTPIPEGNRNTFDNQATTLPMAYLARVIHAGGRPADRAAFDRGLDYILAAQYANGGWPQFYPLRSGYYSQITFNDDAMVRVMTLLRDVAAGTGPYGFTTPEQRARAAAAVDRGVQLILRTQVRQDGVLTVWCAQHDVETLEPAWARAYEPPSLSGNESVGIVRFLMSIPDPSPEVIAAVEGAVAWLEAQAISGLRFETVTGSDGQPEARVVPDPQAPLLWSRFYELGTNRPIFLDRDSVVRYAFAEIDRERRLGYRYYGTWPQTLIRDDYPAWRRKAGLS